MLLEQLDDRAKESPLLADANVMLKELGLEVGSFEHGCALAYRRLAELYEMGDPLFESKYYELVEEELGAAIDEQLSKFRQDSTVPRLGLASVDAKALHAFTWLRPVQGNSIRGVGETGVMRAMLGNVFPLLGMFMLSMRSEIVVTVQYTVRENFQLAPMGNAPPASLYASELEENNETGASEDGESNPPEQAPNKDQAVERKHFFVFAAPMPEVNFEGEAKLSKIGEKVEFRVRRMNSLNFLAGMNMEGRLNSPHETESQEEEKQNKS